MLTSDAIKFGAYCQSKYAMRNPFDIEFLERFPEAGVIRIPKVKPVRFYEDMHSYPPIFFDVEDLKLELVAIGGKRLAWAVYSEWLAKLFVYEEG